MLASVLAACAAYYPEPVEGLSDSSSWIALPLRSWLAEDRAEPEAVALCRPPDCGPGMVVGVVRLHGKDANEAEAVLNHPDRLAQALEEMRGRKSKVRTVATARRLADGPSQGFLLSLGRDDGERAVYGAALGRRDAVACGWCSRSATMPKPSRRPPAGSRPGTSALDPLSRAS